MFVFLLESGLLGLLGGLLGVLAGYGIATYGGKIVLQAGFGILQPVFTWQLVVGCLLFAFVIGLLSGLLPARRASKLNPVDALQYE